MQSKAYALTGLSSSRPIAATAHQAWSWSADALIDMLFLWHARARQRRVLLMLEDYRLEDIGVSRVDAEQEARKPFWRH